MSEENIVKQINEESDSNEQTIQEDPQSEGPKGLGGWLICVGIGRILGPIGNLVAIIQTTRILLDLNENILPHFSLWRNTAVIELLVNIILLLLGIVLLVPFFGKRKVFKKAFISYLLIGCSLTIVSAIFVSKLYNAIPELNGNVNSLFYTVSRSISSAFIWISYTRSSVRVKNTFVR